MFAIFAGKPPEEEPDFHLLGNEVYKWLKAITFGTIMVIAMTYAMVLAW